MNKYQEAIDILQRQFNDGSLTTKDIYGAVQIVDELVDKETPKKPKTIIRTEKSFVNYECPNCDVSWGFTDTKVVKYCPCCGQHLDWSLGV